MSAEDIKAELREGWSDIPAAELCLRIVEYIAAASEGQMKMLTFKSLSHAAGLREVNSDLLTAVAILAGSRISALDAHALFIDDNEEEFELSSEDFDLVNTSGQLIHPETGQAVSNARSKVVPFFVPSHRLTK